MKGDFEIHFIDNYQSEIDCTLRKSCHDKGYATVTLKAIIDYLFKILNKHGIVVSLNPGNKESIRLVDRFGFIKEAHFKQCLLIGGVWVDDIVYAILRTEWD